MARTLTSLALAGALTMAALPAFAYDFNLNPLGLDLDPFHILTPPPPPPAPMVAPVSAHPHHHHVMHHKKKM